MIDYIQIAREHVDELYPFVSYVKPSIDTLPPGSIIGSWAFSVPHKIRFILAPKLQLARGVLPADVTRAWIRTEYKLPLRRRENQMSKCYPSPLHAKIGQHGDCAYVDISGAYLKILSLGFDVEYRRGHYLGGDPRAVPAQIASNKYCYSIAVSTSHSTRSRIDVMGKEGIFTSRPFNMFSNPCLYNLASDTLNAIASEVLAVFGDKCHYINTDGYIVPVELVEPLLSIIRSWGFSARVKNEGLTEVYGVAAWKVGDKRTRRFDGNSKDFTSALTPKDERLWLKKRWQKWEPHLPLPEGIF